MSALWYNTMYPLGYILGKRIMTHRNFPSQLRLEFQGDVLEFTLDAIQPVAVIETDVYETWIDSIADLRTSTRLMKDVGKMRRGLFGDWKEVSGVFEMRLDYGSGYRVYYARHGNVVIILLGGGDKGSQKADLRKARKLWEELKYEIKEV